MQDLKETDKGINILFFGQLKTFFEAAFRFGECIGRVVEDGHLLFAGEVPFQQASDLLFMARQSRLPLQLADESIEEAIGRFDEGIPILFRQLGMERISFHIHQPLQHIHVSMLLRFDRFVRLHLSSLSFHLLFELLDVLLESPLLPMIGQPV